MKTGIDISDDHAAIQRVRQASEKAKVELSTTSQTEINLPYLTFDQTGPKNLMMTLSRSRLEKLTRTFLKKTIKPCE